MLNKVAGAASNSSGFFVRGFNEFTSGLAVLYIYRKMISNFHYRQTEFIEANLGKVYLYKNKTTLGLFKLTEIFMRRHVLKTLVTTCIFSFLAGTPCTAHASKKVAFLVGVNEYKKPGFRNLEYAESDVNEVSKKLKKLGFEITVFQGKEATKAKLDLAILNIVKQLGKKDMIVVMLAEHGQQTAGGDAFFCPYDASTNDETTLLSLSSLIDDTLAPNVGTKLLLVDACRNDPDPGRGRAGGIEGRQIALPKNTAILFSCSEGEQSFEHEKLKQGVFTHCVLDALSGGAANNGELDWFGVLAHVSRKMNSKEIKQFIPKGRVQTPIPASRVPHTVLGRIDTNEFKPKDSPLVVPKTTVMSKTPKKSVEPPLKHSVEHVKQSANKMKQTMLASHNYSDVFNHFPTGTAPNEKHKTNSSINVDERLSWMASILPFNDQVVIHKKLNFNEKWNSNINKPFTSLAIPNFLNPGIKTEVLKKGGSPTHYVGLAGIGIDSISDNPKNAKKDGIFNYNKTCSFTDILDGTSNTIFIIEVNKRIGPWAKGGNSTVRAITKKPYINGPDGFGGSSPKGLNVGMADGSVRFLNSNIDPSLIEAMATKNGGEYVDDF